MPSRFKFSILFPALPMPIMRPAIILLCCALFATSLLWGQNKNAVELEAALKRAGSDSERVSLLVQLSGRYREAQRQALATQRSDEALSIALLSPQRTLLAKALAEKGSDASVKNGGTEAAILRLADALSLVDEGVVQPQTVAAIRRKYASGLASKPASNTLALYEERGINSTLLPLGADSDKVRMNIHAALFEIYQREGKDLLAVPHLREMERYAGRGGQTFDQAWAVAQLASMQYDHGDLKGAYESMIREAALGKRAMLPEVETDALYRLANLYTATGEFPKSVACHQQALALFRQQGNDKGLAIAQNNLGELYAAHGDYDKALILFRLTLQGATAVSNAHIRAAALHNIAEALFHKGDEASALSYYTEAMRLNDSAKAWKFAVQNHLGLGGLDLSAKHYDSAIRHYQIAAVLASREGFADDAAVISAALGKLYLAKFQDSGIKAPNRQQLLMQAIRSLSVAERSASSLGLIKLLQDVYAVRSEAEKASGNYKASMEYFQKSAAIKDSLFSQKNAFKIARLENEASLVEKDREISRSRQEAIGLRRQRMFWYLGAGSFLFLAGAGFFLYRLQRRRKEALLKAEFEKKVTEVEMQALRAQMNPHFIFNCLNSINRYIVKSDPLTASSYLTKFSKLIRFILDNSAANIITLEAERQLLQLYTEMESLRFSNRFTYSIKTDDSIKADATYIPPMLIQPYVENAIWHGLMHRESSGHLSIVFSAEAEGVLKVTIEDNGVGRAQAAVMKSKNSLKEKSYGMRITGNRLRLVNEQHGMDASIHIEDLSDEGGIASGTRVTLYIPFVTSNARSSLAVNTL